MGPGGFAQSGASWQRLKSWREAEGSRGGEQGSRGCAAWTLTFRHSCRKQQSLIETPTPSQAHLHAASSNNNGRSAIECVCHPRSPHSPFATTSLCDMPANTITVDTKLTITHTRTHTATLAGIMRRSAYNIILLSATPANEATATATQKDNNVRWLVLDMPGYVSAKRAKPQSQQENDTGERERGRESGRSRRGKLLGTCHKRTGDMRHCKCHRQHSHARTHSSHTQTPQPRTHTLPAKLENLFQFLSFFVFQLLFSSSLSF